MKRLASRKVKSVLCLIVSVAYFSMSFLSKRNVLDTVNTDKYIPTELCYNVSNYQSDFILQTRLFSKLSFPPNHSYHAIPTRFDLIGSQKLIKAINERKVNNSRDANLLFYTAVPKTGSTALGFYVKTAMASNDNFEAILESEKYMNMSEGTRMTHGFSLPQQLQFYAKYMATALKRSNLPVISISHHCYFDLRLHNVPEKYLPNWIGSVRDPINRYASWYYYRTSNISIGAKNKPAAFKLDFATFDECVQARHEECYYPDNVIDRFQYSFFCGNAPECFHFSNKQALQLAKFNVEQDYAVVGVLEIMDTTMHVLAKLLPQFFDLPARTFFQITNRIKKQSGAPHTNRNNDSLPVQPETRRILYKNPVFMLEYEFYEFVKQRLYFQAINLKSTS